MDHAAWDNSSSERATSASTRSGWRLNPRSTRSFRDLAFVATGIKLSSPMIAPDKCLTIDRNLLGLPQERWRSYTHLAVHDNLGRVSSEVVGIGMRSPR